jgi:hypothetical protein
MITRSVSPVSARIQESGDSRRSGETEYPPVSRSRPAALEYLHGATLSGELRLRPTGRRRHVHAYSLACNSFTCNNRICSCGVRQFPGPPLWTVRAIIESVRPPPPCRGPRIREVRHNNASGVDSRIHTIRPIRRSEFCGRSPIRLASCL